MTNNNNFDFIADLPGIMAVKDAESRYIAMTLAAANMLGWKSCLQGQGKTDYELPCKAVESADEYKQRDDSVLVHQTRMLTLGIQQFADGWKILLTERNPLDNKTGILVRGMDVSNIALFKSYLTLHQLDNKLLGKQLKPVNYILNNQHMPLKLTDKQANCLFLLIRGKTIQDIADVFQLSKRTIESHLDALKNKLNAQNKAEVIEKAIRSGFLYYVPSYFQQSNIEGVF